MLAGIENQHHVPRAERVSNGLGERAAGLRPYPERRGDPQRDQRGIFGVAELDQPGTAGKAGHQLAGQPERQPGLADAARAAQGQGADLAEQQGKLRQISLAADETVRLRGEIARAGGGISSHCLSDADAET